MDRKLFDGCWAPTRDDSLPAGSLVGGHDHGNHDIIVARAKHENDLVPGKFIPSKQVAYVAWKGKEVIVSELETLTIPSEVATWIACDSGVVLPTAIPGGVTADGETLYIGRCAHKGTLTVGKVHPSHKCIYIPYDAREVSFSHYELLCIKNRSYVTELINRQTFADLATEK